VTRRTLRGSGQQPARRRSGGGPVALAVTTNLNINFLRKPVPGGLLADCEILKLGKRLAVGSVTIREEGEDEPVAHATSTYSIPPPSK